MHIAKEWTGGQNASELLIKADILRLVGILIRHFGHLARKKADSHGSDKARELLKNTFNLIDKSYTNVLPLKEVVRASHLSVPHFSRLFKQSTGMTFTEYLGFYRVNRAEELFSSSLSITEIAYDCGFGSIAAFNRAFRKYRNMTPSQSRNQ